MNQEVVQGLKNGRSLRLDRGISSWEDIETLVTKLEQAVGLPLERRVVIDGLGEAVLCWVKGFPQPQMLRYYQGVNSDAPSC